MVASRAMKVAVVFAFFTGITIGGIFSTLSVSSGSSLNELRQNSKRVMVEPLCYCDYLPDTTFLAPALAKLPNISKEECCDICIRTEGCSAWSAVDSVCVLKNVPRDEVREKATKLSGVWSGLTCQPHPPLTRPLRVPIPALSLPPTHPPTPPTLPPSLPPSPVVKRSPEEHMAYLASLTTQEQRQQAIREAVLHAWTGYASLCFGHDDLRPLSQSCDDWLGSQGNTLIDSLSTLHIAGLHDEFARATSWVRDKMDFNRVGSASHFETVIRVLGGLLSAFDLSGDSVFLTRAKDLGNRMKGVFSAGTGLPYRSITVNSGRGDGDGTSLADIGTLTMEYFDLSHHTDDPSHRDRAHRVTKHVAGSNSQSGMYPNHWHVGNGGSSGTISFGGEGDSFYEYLIKLWLLTERQHDMYKDMFIRAIDGMTSRLVRRGGQYTWLSEIPDNNNMGHLACFVPGMLALGAASGIVDTAKSGDYLSLAEAIGSTCYHLYEMQPTGIGPDSAWMSANPSANDRRYINRPETTESIFYLWRVTKKPQYREWGWKIFLAMEKHIRTTVGYAGLADVTRVGSGQIDKMESFFIAETLKYLYLLQSPDEALPLAGIDDDGGKKPGRFFVFNTEAHPLLTFKDQPLPSRRLLELLTLEHR